VISRSRRRTSPKWCGRPGRRDQQDPNTQAIYILVEKNPNTLAAGFGIPAGTEANVATRIKMGQTSNVYAVVKADNKFYTASKEVKVTLGGCGG